jgi:hypothetical protein
MSEVTRILDRVQQGEARAGMDTKQVIARFEAERQALAMMDHPNIAKVFDAGATGQRSEVQGGACLTSDCTTGYRCPTATGTNAWQPLTNITLGSSPTVIQQPLDSTNRFYRGAWVR